MKIQKRNKVLAIILGFIAAVSFAFMGISYIAKADVVEYEKGKVEVYQIIPENNTLSEGYVIKTANDKIVVIDGGVDKYDMDTYLPQAIRAILGLEEGAFFHVDAWFLSHPHNDHIFELTKMLNGYVDEDDESLVDGKVEIKVPTSLTDGTPKATTYVTPDNNFTIGKFYFDFPTWNYKCGDTSSCLPNFKNGLEVYAKAHPEVEDFTLTNGAYDVYSELNGKYINRDTIKEGQNIYIDGVRFEIMQTWSYGDGQANNNSMVIRMWVDGQSVMFLNDIAVSAGQRLLDTYGADYIKSDIVQLAHHGQNGADKPVYDAIDAKVRLWSNFRDLWNAKTANSANQTPTVRGWFGLDILTASTSTDLVAALSICPENPYDQSSWTAEVLNSMKISLPYVPAYEDESGFEMNEGASVRLNEGTGNAGLRFSAKLSAYDDSATYGFVIAPREYFDAYTGNYAQNLIENSATTPIIDLKCKMVDGAAKNSGNHYEIQGSISMIKYANMNREFTGLAYMLKDGVYTDAKFDSLDDITRSVLDVALKANASGDFSEEDNAEDLAIIKSFIHKGVMKEQGVTESNYDANAELNVSLAFDKTSASLEYGDSTTVEIITDVDSGLVAYDYDEKMISFDPETGKVIPLALGTTTLTASCYDKTATFTVTTETKEGYYITFENENTLNAVTLNDRAFRTGKSIKTELATNVTDKNGITEPSAVKITTTAGTSNICDIVINLPKEVDLEAHDGVTIAINFASTESTFAIFNVNFWETTNTETGRPILGAKNPVSYSGKGLNPFTTAEQRDAALNTWKYMYIDYTTCGADFDKVIIAMSSIPNNGESVIYVAYVAEGDVVEEKTAAAQEQLMGQLTATLTDGYLAQFDHELYTSLVSTVSSSYYWEGAGHKVELLDEYEGEKGVLKFTGTANTANNQGWIKIKLPKPHSGSYTVRAYIATTEKPALNTIFGGVNGSTGIYDKVLNTAACADKWEDYYVTTAGDTNYIFMAVANTGGAKVEVYFSYVYDGQKLDLSTPEGYLATYDNSDWVNMVSAPSSTYYFDETGKMQAEYLESFQGETGVVKVTGRINSSNGGAIVKLALPKAHSGKYTIRFWIAETEKNPGLIGFSHTVSLSRIAGSFWYGDSVPANNVWHTKVVTTSEDTSAVYFEAGNGQGSYLEVYFAFIMDGDIKDVVKNTLAGKITEENVLADFSSKEYIELIENSSSSYSVTSYTAEILDSYTDAANVTKYGVLKLTLNFTTTGWHMVNLTLPKEYTGTFTIDVAVAEGYSGGLGIGRPNTAVNTDLYNNYTVAGGAGYAIQAANTFYKITMPEKGFSETGAIGIGAVNQTVTSMTIYIDCIYNGQV